MARFQASILCLSALVALCAPAAEQTQLDTSPAVFSVMAAYDAARATPANTPADAFRAAVRHEILAKKPAVLADLRTYFSEHKQNDPGADLAQYVSFALVTSGAPDYTLRLSGNEVPPDVQDLRGFSELMARFHREAAIDDLWAKAQPHYENALAGFQEPVGRTLLEVNGYLRNITSGYMGRRFQVLVDLVAPSSQVHTRSYKDDYFVVVPPPASAHIDDIRHAALHFLLDPLAAKYAERLDRSRGLIDYAQAAPALDPGLKSDFLLLATESLIKAVEARLTRQPASVQQALAEGHVLTPYFAERLPFYEKQEAAMRLYLPEMLNSIDLKKEAKRLEGVQFAAAPVRRAVAPAEEPVQQTASEKALDEADRLYTGRDLEAAREAYLKIVRRSDDKALHARAYFGLARVAALKNEAELAEQMFQKTLESAPDPHTRSWAEVYLGRVAEGFGDRDLATRHYQAALAVEGAPPGARQAAEQGVQKLSAR